jgi:sigma-B regulation protein RsbU (phosphoserine phosphatase)
MSVATWADTDTDNSSFGISVDTPRVLVADDQGDIVEALTLLLTDAGFLVDGVTSPRDVLARIDSAGYDLLLLDLNYTRDTTSAGEGLSLLRDIRLRTEQLPIVVMTGWGTIDVAVEAMRRGARSFVQKPWDDLQLVEIVRREVADARAAQSQIALFGRERRDAQAIQRASLPSGPLSIAGCEIAARWCPALGLGGDCYDVIAFDDTRAAVSIGDAIGKGLPAALLMSSLQAAVRAFAAADLDAARVCRSVNRLLCRTIASGKFASFCYAIVDTASRTLEYCNAGHNSPILVTGNREVQRLVSTGLVLGIDDQASYSAHTLSIHRGDRLIWFTDGVTEAKSLKGDDFSDDRLVDFVASADVLSADDLADLIVSAARAWRGGAFEDDVTVLVMSVE